MDGDNIMNKFRLSKINKTMAGLSVAAAVMVMPLKAGADEGKFGESLKVHWETAPGLEIEGHNNQSSTHPINHNQFSEVAVGIAHRTMPTMSGCSLGPAMHVESSGVSELRESTGLVGVAHNCEIDFGGEEKASVSVHVGAHASNVDAEAEPAVRAQMKLPLGIFLKAFGR